MAVVHLQLVCEPHIQLKLISHVGGQFVAYEFLIYQVGIRPHPQNLSSNTLILSCGKIAGVTEIKLWPFSQLGKTKVC